MPQAANATRAKPGTLSASTARRSRPARPTDRRRSPPRAAGCSPSAWRARMAITAPSARRARTALLARTTARSPRAARTARVGRRRSRPVDRTWTRRRAGVLQSRALRQRIHTSGGRIRMRSSSRMARRPGSAATTSRNASSLRSTAMTSRAPASSGRRKTTMPAVLVGG